MKMRFYALWLSLICVAVYFVQLAVPGFTNSFILDSHFSYEAWRFVTSIFLHGSLGHLLLNIFALALFGTILESLIGGKRFLLVFFASGIIANLVSINYYPLSLGASGAIYGVLGTLVILRPMLAVWVYGFPMPMFIAGIVWIAADSIGIFIPSDVGHIAHLVGIAVGLVLGIFFRDWRAQRARRGKLKIHEGYMRAWEDAYVKK